MFGAITRETLSVIMPRFQNNGAIDVSAKINDSSGTIDYHGEFIIDARIP